MFNVLLYGIAADTQLLGDLPLGQSLSLHQQYVQNGLLFFKCATSLTMMREKIIP